jgi:hypothetical protein
MSSLGFLPQLIPKLLPPSPPHHISHTHCCLPTDMENDKDQVKDWTKPTYNLSFFDLDYRLTLPRKDESHVSDSPVTFQLQQSSR